jgi:hypothetical protein
VGGDAGAGARSRRLDERAFLRPTTGQPVISAGGLRAIPASGRGSRPRGPRVPQWFSAGRSVGPAASSLTQTEEPADPLFIPGRIRGGGLATVRRRRGNGGGVVKAYGMEITAPIALVQPGGPG